MQPVAESPEILNFQYVSEQTCLSVHSNSRDAHETAWRAVKFDDRRSLTMKMPSIKYFSLSRLHRPIQKYGRRLAIAMNREIAAETLKQTDTQIVSSGFIRLFRHL